MRGRLAGTLLVLTMLASGMASAGPLAPGASWVTLLDEGFTGEAALHPSWRFECGWPRFAGSAGARHMDLGPGLACLGDVGSPDWRRHLVTLKLRLPPGSEVELFREFITGPWQRAYSVQIFANKGVWKVGLSVRDGHPTPHKIVPASDGSGLLELQVKQDADSITVVLDGQQVLTREVSTPDRAAMFRIKWQSGEAVELHRLTIHGPRPDTWRRLTGFPAHRVDSLSINPLRPTEIIACGYHTGLFTSRDSGQSWRLTSVGLNNVQWSWVRRNPYLPSMLMAGEYSQGSRAVSLDGGARWFISVGVPGALSVHGTIPVAFSPLDTGRLYMASRAGSGLIWSEDSGRTMSWVKAAHKPTCLNEPLSIAVTPGPAGDQIWVGGTEGGLCRSNNQGETWEVTDALPAPIAALALCDGELAVGARDTVHTTAGWRQPLDSVAWRRTRLPGGAHRIRCPGRRIYAATRKRIAWSGDAALAQGSLESGLVVTDIHDFAVSPPGARHPGEIWFAGSGLFRTSPGSKRIEVLSRKIGIGGAIAVATAPHDPSTVWAASWDRGGVLRSADGGDTWTALLPEVDSSSSNTSEEDALVATSIHMLAVEPSSGRTVLAAAAAGVLATRDGGATWAKLGAGAGLGTDGVTDIQFHPRAPRRVYAARACMARYFRTVRDCAAAKLGLFRSDDGGLTFSWKGAPPGSPGIITLALDPTDPDHLWAGTWDAGLWESRDGGGSFTRLGKTTLAPRHVQAIAVMPGSPRTLLVGAIAHYAEQYAEMLGLPAPAAVDGIYRSSDGGGTWSHAKETAKLPVERLLFHPAVPGLVYAGTHSPGVWRSTDDGKSWSSYNEGMLYTDDTRHMFNVAWDLAVSADGEALYATSGGHGVLRMGQPGRRIGAQSLLERSLLAGASDGCAVTGAGRGGSGALWLLLGLLLARVRARGRRR